VSRRLGPANHVNYRMRRQTLASKRRQSGFADTARPIVWWVVRRHYSRRPPLLVSARTRFPVRYKNFPVARL